ncbi:threonine synthase [Wenzhouxiangella sp. EGI_FJ10409]|uniref:threonine synthase n=1 Tax=Wenzhouxiangella sp. EGI_FJ10409 TaxID=3243767 RepID=UPI0035D9B713
MRFISTAGNASADLAEALTSGLAPDGGLFVPEELPHLEPDALDGCATLPESAYKTLAPFFAGSPLADELPVICNEALDLPLPINRLAVPDGARSEAEHASAWLLELFHGPTAAFKDFAARFLAACLSRLRADDAPVRTVLVATSGDTGAAVAAAFHRRAGFRVVVLYPDGRVSARQAHQLGAFGDNVATYRVQGNFDDCQRLVKRALNDRELLEQVPMTSANSISIGRLLPQISYYAHAASKLFTETREPIDVIVPTGNLGNALACILAREMGLPIGRVTLATNANRALPEYFSGGEFNPREAVATLANAMDVGRPSNFERLAWLFRDRDARDAGIDAVGIDDKRIRETIVRTERERGLVVCPHTACAMAAFEDRRRAGHDRPALVVATAHPAKFEQVVEPLLGREIPPPPALAELLRKDSRAIPMVAEYGALRDVLVSG